MSLHINSIIEKVRRREKPKPIVNTKKAIPVFLYPCEATVYTKNDVITVKRNALCGSKEVAYYEMETYLKKQGAYDYTISITMPQGHHVDLVGQDAGVSIRNTFDPFCKAEEKNAVKMKQEDLASASKSAKVERSRDGAELTDLNAKLQRAHNQSLHI